MDDLVMDIWIEESYEKGLAYPCTVRPTHIPDNVKRFKPRVSHGYWI